MLPVVRQLKELSEVDALIAEAQGQLALYPKMLGKLVGEEETERKKAEAAKARGDEARNKRRQAEQETASLREKVKKTLGQQGMVKTNKEFEAMTHEIEGLNAKIDTQDTVGLEMIEAEEKAGREQKEAEKKLERALAENAAEKERIKGQIADKQEKLVRLQSEQKRKFAELPDDWQQTYELMNPRTPGSVAVRLDRDQCGGCHMTLPPGTQQHVRSGDQIVRCDHCRRVLFVDE